MCVSMIGECVCVVCASLVLPSSDLNACTHVNISTGSDDEHESLEQAYEFVLKTMGADVHAATVWRDYVQFIKNIPVGRCMRICMRDICDMRDISPAHMHMHTSIHMHMHTHAHTHMHTYMHIHTCTHTCPYTHTYTYMHIHIHIHMHVHIHIHIRIHIHMHTHTYTHTSHHITPHHSHHITSHRIASHRIASHRIASHPIDIPSHRHDIDIT